MFSGIFFFANIASAAIADLKKQCGDNYDTWYDVPESSWYWEDDWRQEQAAGNTVYPVGFRSYVLKEFNEPPVCIHVPNSKDKKVEILIESTEPNANICVQDASDMGVETNNVGMVSTCGRGQFYACFTAAVAEDPDGDTEGTNFSFFIHCEESCEASDVDLVVRVRTSEQSWLEGKSGVDSDLEMWCEMEKGTEVLNDQGESYDPIRYYNTYPSELIPDEPSVYPFHIKHLFGNSSGSQTKPNNHIITIGILSVFALLCICGGGAAHYNK